MITLDKRLSAAALSIDKCNVLADIGSDHGYLPIRLLLTKKINKAVITDINKAPLESSIRNAEIYHVSEFCDFRCGSGLDLIKENECDVISICGMGGDTIAQIIRENLSIAHSAKKLVLQPMTNQITLRKMLIDNGFEITDEKMVKDRHLFYQIITAQSGTCDNYQTDIDYEFPKLLLEKRDRVFQDFLHFKLQLEERILANIFTMAEHSKDVLIDHTQKRIEYIKEMLSTYES